MSNVLMAMRRGERVAAKEAMRVLRQALGWTKAARVLIQLGARKLRGEPFAQLGPPLDERDRLSRRQCADLVLLDRALSAQLPAVERAALLGGVVLAGAGPFLDGMLPELALGPGQLAGIAPTLAESFFNAEGEVQQSEPGSFRFEVSRCRFVELLAAVDASHLAPLFCAADESYFDGIRRPIVLHRTRTLARGGHSCDFRFELVSAKG